MAGPSKYGPAGGPPTGGLEPSQDFATQYNKAAQEKQQAIFETKQAEKTPDEQERKQASKEIAEKLAASSFSRVPELQKEKEQGL